LLVFRHRATDPSQRLGSRFVNGGGVACQRPVRRHHRQLHVTTIWVPLHPAVELPPNVITQVRRL